MSRPLPDPWDKIEADMADAPLLPTVIKGFGEAVAAVMKQAEPGEAQYMFGLTWGEHPDTKAPGLRYTVIAKIPDGMRALKAPLPGVAWLFGVAKRPGGETDSARVSVVHEDSCPAGSGGRPWNCNCISEIVLDEAS